MPHTYAILMLIIVISWLLTYIIPAGEYAREKKRTNHSYSWYLSHSIFRTSKFLNIFRAVPEGLISGGNCFYVFLVGGAFGIVHKTGAFENGVNKAMRVLGKANF